MGEPEARRGPAFQNLGGFLFRGTVGTLVLQGLTILLMMSTSVALARALGAAGFGAYSYALTWANLLMLPATLGLQQVLSREAAVALREEQWSTIAGLLWFSRRATLGMALLVGVALGVGAVLARPSLGDALFWPLVVASPLVLINSQMTNMRFFLIGLRRVVIAQWAESVLRPAAFLGLVGLAWWAMGDGLDPTIAMGLQATAAAAALIAMAVIVGRSVPDEVRSAQPRLATRLWLRSAAPLLFLAISRHVNKEASVLLMGSFLDEADIGVFRAAHRIATLLSIALLALNQSFSPVAASLFAEDDLRRLEITAIRVARVALLVSVPLYAGMVLFDGPLLSIFGAEFTGGERILWILGLGELVNVAVGPVAITLIMSRHEDDTARVLVATMFASLALNAVGMWWLGLEGAAWATTAGQAVSNLLLLAFVYKRLGLVLGALSWRWLRL